MVKSETLDGSIKALIDIHLEHVEQTNRPAWARLQDAAKADALLTVLLMASGESYRRQDVDRACEKALDAFFDREDALIRSAVERTRSIYRQEE